jgi:hypothetical protein
MESMQGKHTTSPTPKMFRVEKSAGKVMATVFWDEKVLLLLEYFCDKLFLSYSGRQIIEHPSYVVTVIRHNGTRDIQDIIATVNHN